MTGRALIKEYLEEYGYFFIMFEDARFNFNQMIMGIERKREPVEKKIFTQKM